MERINVVGCSGSGKSTLAAHLAERLGYTHIELDAIFHQPGWAPLPPDDFRARVVEAVAADRWIIDGNYSVVGPVVRERADTIVWLDLPRWRVIAQIVPRTVARAVSRQELWNGNREPLLGILHWNPERSIVRWAWTTHGRMRERYEKLMTDPDLAHVRFVRLRSRREVRRWLAQL